MRKINDLKMEAEAERFRREREKEAKRIIAEEAARKRKRYAAIAALVSAVCFALAVFYITVIAPRLKLNKAMALLNSGDYDAAYALLAEIKKDDMIRSSKYDRAKVLLDTGDYDAAYDLLAEIGEDDMIRSSKYDRAKAFLDSGDYKSAYSLLNGLSYKDSSQIIPQKLKALLADAKTGDCVNFGVWEQDNNTSNGKESIEWQVVDRQENRVLLISRYALDCRPYNTGYTNVTWESSSLRAWLNVTFLNEVFSAEEQTLIPQVTVSADKNPRFSTDPGNSTTDRIFLLSISEVERYFASDETRQVFLTEYAKAQGAYTTGNGGNTFWWLRSPGNRRNTVANVRNDGSVSFIGNSISNSSGAVRPALWIDL